MSAGRPREPSRWPPERPSPRAATRDAIIIAALSVAVAVHGGFHPALNLVIAALGGITAAVIIYKEHT